MHNRNFAKLPGQFICFLPWWDVCCDFWTVDRTCPPSDFFLLVNHQDHFCSATFITGHILHICNTPQFTCPNNLAIAEQCHHAWKPIIRRFVNPFQVSWVNDCEGIPIPDSTPEPLGLTGIKAVSFQGLNQPFLSLIIHSNIFNMNPASHFVNHNFHVIHIEFFHFIIPTRLQPQHVTHLGCQASIMIPFFIPSELPDPCTTFFDFILPRWFSINACSQAWCCFL